MGLFAKFLIVAGDEFLFLFLKIFLIAEFNAFLEFYPFAGKLFKIGTYNCIGHGITVPCKKRFFHLVGDKLYQRFLVLPLGKFYGLFNQPFNDLSVMPETDLIGVIRYTPGFFDKFLSLR